MTGLQKKRGRSIKSRLILLLLLILIPVLTIQAYMYYESYQARRASELQANLEIARLLAKSFESFVQDVIHQELAISLVITSSPPMTSKNITRLLETSRDYVAVRDFTWLNTNGIAVYSSNPAMIGINYSDRSYFREIANGREWTVSELVMAKTTAEPVFAIARGIRDSKGNLLGIVFAPIIPEKLDARLAIERGTGGGYALVDNKGMLVYRYPAINATWEERNWLELYPEFEEALKGKEFTKSVYAFYEGKTRLVGFTPVSSIGWVACAGKREEDINRPILISIGTSALVFLIVSFAAFFIALAVSRKITNSITALRARALALGQGEVPEQVEINSVSEFQDLAKAFNTMAEKVRARETDLRESEERLRHAQVTGQVGAWDWNSATKELRCTPEIEAIYGLKPGTIRTYKDFTVRVHPDDLEMLEARRNRAVEEHKTFEFEYRIRRSDGEMRWIYCRGGAIYDNAGQPTQVFGVNIDITERKQMEQRIIELNQRLQALMNALPVGVSFSDDVTCRSIKGNPAVLKQFEVGLEDNLSASAPDASAPGRQVRFFKDGQEISDSELPLQRAVKENKEIPAMELEIELPSGRRWFSDASGAPIRDEQGNIIGGVAVTVDITGRKQAEEALKKYSSQLEEANKELESFSYSVSHDLRAPLRAIDGYARSILRKQGDKFDEDTKRRFNEIRLNTQMMGKLVDDLLAFSRLGRKDVSMSKIDMEALIGDVWKELHAITPDRNINLTVNSMPPAYGDRTLIKQVCINLLSNAVKFSKFRNPALIKVGGHVHGDENVYYVKDNGVGFDMQYYDKLFGVFQRLHKPDDFEGTGIGLATVHRIINRHGGRVWAEGKEGEGATFFFSLPPPLTH